MKNKFLTATLCASLGLGLATMAQAREHDENNYNPQRFAQVCRGKTVGASASFAANGILWNGTCQAQFIPAKPSKALKGDEPELSSVCSTDPSSKSVNIAGQNFTGKCALAFTPPSPQHP